MSRTEKGFNIAASVATIASVIVGFLGYQVGEGRGEERVRVAVDGALQSVANEAEALPEGRRDFALILVGVLDSAVTSAIAEGPGGTEAQAAAQRFASAIAEAPLASYDATSSPFSLRPGSTVLACDREVSIGLPEAAQNGRAILQINGRRLNANPGFQREVQIPGATARIRMLDTNETSGGVMIEFDCDAGG